MSLLVGFDNEVVAGYDRAMRAVHAVLLLPSGLWTFTFRTQHMTLQSVQGTEMRRTKQHWICLGGRTIILLVAAG